MNTLRKISETKSREWIINSMVSENYLTKESCKGRKLTNLQFIWCNMMETKMINSINKLN